MKKKSRVEKKINEMDIPRDVDLAFGLMNIISLEEHFEYSYMKTGIEKYLLFANEIRKIRAKLLAKLVPKVRGQAEAWCTCKHFLAATMRLMETGMKEIYAGNKEESEMYFRCAQMLFNMLFMLKVASELGELGGKK
ncbi:MAG: hypothetical protein ACTSV7_00840 [Candidatus Baldrarchaeia archaeon]